MSSSFSFILYANAINWSGSDGKISGGGRKRYCKGGTSLLELLPMKCRRDDERIANPTLNRNGMPEKKIKYLSMKIP